MWGLLADAKTVEYRVERRFDSRFGFDLYHLVEVRGGGAVTNLYSETGLGQLIFE